MSATYQVRMFEVECRHCRRGFPIPLLNDFTYGEFILHGERGGVFGYLSAFTCPLFKDIHSRLLTIAGCQEFTSAESARFREILACCADELDGQPLGLPSVCPFCRSQNLNYHDRRPLNDDLIRVVTFIGFESLSDKAKMEKLSDLWQQ